MSTRKVYRYNIEGCGESRIISELQQIYDIVFLWDKTLALNPINNNQHFWQVHHNLIEDCSQIEQNFYTDVIRPQLIQRGIYLYSKGILNGNIDDINGFANLLYNDNSSGSVQLVDYINENNFKNDAYMNYFYGHLHTGRYYDVDIDYEQAKIYFRVAADGGIPDAWYMLAKNREIELYDVGSYHPYNDDYDGSKNQYDDESCEDYDDFCNDDTDFEEEYYPKDQYNEKSIDTDKYYEIIHLYELAAAKGHVPSLLTLAYSDNEEISNRYKAIIEGYLSDIENYHSIILKIAQWYEKKEKYLDAIKFYSSLADYDPKFLSEMAKLCREIKKEESFLNKKLIIDCYELYLSKATDSEIQFELFSIYDSINNERKMHWLKEAAKNGHPYAQHQLIDIYDEKIKDASDQKEAFNLYQKVCSLVSYGYSSFCYAYYELQEDLSLIEKANEGDAEAEYLLGRVLNKHRFYHMAQYYFDKAASQGHEEAKRMQELNKIYIKTSLRFGFE